MKLCTPYGFVILLTVYLSFLQVSITVAIFPERKQAGNYFS